MAQKRQWQELYVYMNGTAVGTLTLENNGQLKFAYDLNWLNLEDSRPISISMPLTDVPYKGEIVDYYFDNLLPDNELIRDRIQTRFHAPSKKPFDLLALIGGDCVGALQILPQAKSPYIKKIQALPISKTNIAKLLKHYQTAPLGMDSNIDLRISIAGAQEKTALLWHDNKWQLPLGATPTSHIIKLPIGIIKHSGLDLSTNVENEWLCLKILALYNLPVNQADIVQFEDVKTLVVERFDRRWAENQRWLMRLPQEDFCQALGKPSGLKYESDGGPGIQDIMRVLLNSANQIDRKNFLKSVFLFWVLGAIDGHAKNFSIAIESQGRYHLTPLYDVISAYPLASKRQLDWQKLKMAMSLKSKNRHYLWNSMEKRHWLAVAAQCQFPEKMMQEIMDEALDNIETVIAKATKLLPKQFPSQIADTIFAGMRKAKNRLK